MDWLYDYIDLISGISLGAGIWMMGKGIAAIVRWMRKPPEPPEPLSKYGQYIMDHLYKSGWVLNPSGHRIIYGEISQYGGGKIGIFPCGSHSEFLIGGRDVGSLLTHHDRTEIRMKAEQVRDAIQGEAKRDKRAKLIADVEAFISK